MKRPLVISVLLGLLAKVQGEVVPSPLFGDHAVLPSGDSIDVWGTARDGEAVSVTYGTITVRTAATQGRWAVRLPGLKPTAVPRDLIFQGENRVVSSDVIVGDLWLCAGQSNMELRLREADPADAEAAVKNPVPALRWFDLYRIPSKEPAGVVRGRWLVPVGQTLREMTAVGYHFGRSLLQHRPGIPVGVIGGGVGGTSISAWVSHQTALDEPAFAPLLERYNKSVETYPKQLAAYEKAKAEYAIKAAEAKAAGHPEPNPPNPVWDPEKGRGAPARLYNGMIAPLRGLALTGVVWYQGEANCWNGSSYRSMLTSLVTEWRTEFKRQDLPFLVVQLPNHKGLTPELREAQMRVATEMPRVGIVCTIDVGDPQDIHPKNKRPVGERLALVARSLAYGEKGVSSGPRYAGLTIEGSIAIVRFTATDGGLVANDGKLTDFTLAGADGNFVPAEARIVGTTVEVQAAGIVAPKAVRYAWANLPMAALSNGAGLPAFPFRTDELPTERFPPL